MKIFAFLFLATLSAPAFAHDGIAFLAKSVLPGSLQMKVSEAVKARCIPALFDFSEESTVISESPAGHHYRTFLTATYYFDGMHPSGADITVDSDEQAGVLSVTGDMAGLCN